MAAQTIGPITAVQGETSTVAKAYSIVDGTLVGTSATLAAAGASGVLYYPVFTDLPAAEYEVVLFDSSGNALTVGYATVAAATATYELTDEPSTSLRSTSIAAILEDTGTTIPGILGTPAGDDLAADIAAIDGGSGTGARTVTITVDDGSSPIEGARVRMTKGGEDYVVSTDVNGQIVVGRDDGTWAVVVTAPTYDSEVTTLVVNGTESVTYSLDATSIPAAPTASTSTGVATVLSQAGVAESGVSVSVKIIRGPGTAGFAYDSKLWTETSDVNGAVSFAGLVRGATYRAYRGRVTSNSQFTEFLVPDSASFSIGEMVGGDD